MSRRSRPMLFAAAVIAVSAILAATSGRASADGSPGVTCGIGNYPNCLWINPPQPGTAGIGYFGLLYGGFVHYTNPAYIVCMQVRLMRGDGAKLQEKTECNFYSGDVSGFRNEYNIYGQYCRCKQYRTWAHSWEVYLDMTQHADRYAASSWMVY